MIVRNLVTVLLLVGVRPTFFLSRLGSVWGSIALNLRKISRARQNIRQKTVRAAICAV